jgi:hypothetical protein
VSVSSHSTGSCPGRAARQRDDHRRSGQQCPSTSEHDITLFIAPAATTIDILASEPEAARLVAPWSLSTDATMTKTNAQVSSARAARCGDTGPTTRMETSTPTRRSRATAQPTRMLVSFARARVVSPSVGGGKPPFARYVAGAGVAWLARTRITTLAIKIQSAAAGAPNAPARTPSTTATHPSQVGSGPLRMIAMPLATRNTATPAPAMNVFRSFWSTFSVWRTDGVDVTDGIRHRESDAGTERPRHCEEDHSGVSDGRQPPIGRDVAQVLAQVPEEEQPFKDGQPDDERRERKRRLVLVDGSGDFRRARV